MPRRAQQVLDLLCAGRRTVERAVVEKVGGPEQGPLGVRHREHGPGVIRRQDRHGEIEGQRRAGEQEVRAARRPQARPMLAPHRADLVGPHPGRADDHGRPHLEQSPAFEVGHPGPGRTAVGVSHQLLDARVTERGAARERAGGDDRQHEAGVVRDRVVVQQPELEPLAAKLGDHSGRLVRAHPGVPVTDGRQVVVHRKAEVDLPARRHVVLIRGVKEPHRPHEVGVGQRQERRARGTPFG